MNIQDDPRWQILASRQQDDSFFYSVKTTGVYCRPGCASRLARPENVRFHDSPAQAEEAGFRPCKRCQPDQKSLRERQAQIVAEACRSLEQSEEPTDLKELAEQAGLSPFHFHRLFSKLLGVTPRQYQRARRAERMREVLPGAPSVTEAIYAAGYQSTSRFYEHSQEMLGMPPAHYKNGGSPGVIHYTLRPGRLVAWILVAATPQGVCAILLGPDRQQLRLELRRRFPQAQLQEGSDHFREWVDSAVATVEGDSSCPDLPLDVRGTVFQHKVWEALRQIPPGQTRTYSQLAQQLGRPSAARAVAAACAANPVAIAIPCHRVIRADGSLAGYHWGGPEVKRSLLAREK